MKVNWSKHYDAFNPEIISPPKVIRGRGYLGVQKSVANKLYSMKYLDDKLTTAELSGLVEMIHDHVMAAWQEGLIRGEEPEEKKIQIEFHVVCNHCDSDLGNWNKYEGKVESEQCPRCGMINTLNVKSVRVKMKPKKRVVRCSRCGIYPSGANSHRECPFCGGVLILEEVEE